MRWTYLKRCIEDVTDDLEIRLEAAAEAAKIAEREMKDASKEAKVKAAAAKAVNSVSSAGTLSVATAASTDASGFARAPTYTSSVVGVARRSEYTLIIIMLKN